MKRLTAFELVALLKAVMPHGKTAEDLATGHIISTAITASEKMQVFDFGNLEHVSNAVDKKLAAELWHKKLLRLPFPVTQLTYRTDRNRLTVLALDDVDIEDDEGLNKSYTAFLLLTHHSDDWRTTTPDAFVWFDVPDGEHVAAGALKLTECPGESRKSFQNYCVTAVARVITLCMLLNTKGIPKRYEPAPVKLNKKRAANGKPPISAVTYIDLSHMTSGHGGGSGEKSMHLRRGHMRHYEDGSTTWVRHCVVKAEGTIKVRERYQLRESGV